MMQPPANHDGMVTDANTAETQSTQQTQQETQPASQIEPTLDTHLWGQLIPCNSLHQKIDFQKMKPTYTIGRNKNEVNGNDIVFHGLKISNFHCRINWDGREDKNSAVRVTDLSSNGTFINSVKIGKGKSMLLYEGNELAFGTPHPQPANNGLEDYRFVYRHLAGGTPSTGLHAHYHVHGELGKGSFATVMKAMHRDTGQWYAVKVMQRNRLRTALAANGNGDHTFEREIRILEELHHSNICQLKEVFYEEHTVNLVLEYVQGGDLLDYIVDRQQLMESEAQRFTYQICDALAYIHQKGIAHRDLKPENVLLTDEQPPNVKVADFGLAKAVDSMTMLRTMCGTPCYLAPEVVLQGHNEGYDHVVDSWSVGVIVYSMLTGNNPFIEDVEQELSQRVRTRVVDWDNLRRLASANAENFVKRLLENDPQRRMTPSAAREHPWLAAFHTAVPTPLRERTASPDPEPANTDSSVISNFSDMAVEESMNGHNEGVLVDQQPSLIGVSGSQPGDIPGAYPHSQPGLQRQPSRVQRRADVIASQQSEEDVVLSDDEEPEDPRRQRREVQFEGSLTPMEEEEEEEDEEEQEGYDGNVRPRRNAARNATANGGVERRRRDRPAVPHNEGPLARMRRLKAEKAARGESHTAGEPSRLRQPGVRRSTRLNPPQAVKLTRRV